MLIIIEKEWEQGSELWIVSCELWTELASSIKSKDGFYK